LSRHEYINTSTESGREIMESIPRMIETHVLWCFYRWRVSLSQTLTKCTWIRLQL